MRAPLCRSILLRAFFLSGPFLVLAATARIASITLAAATEARGSFRIVSLNPTLTRLLIDLELGANVVGVVTVPGMPLPKGVPVQVKTVGSYAKPLMEKIIALRPSHVLLIKEGEDRISAQLKKAGTKVLILEGRFLKDFEPLVRTLGETFARDPGKIEALLSRWRSDWAAVDQSVGRVESSKRVHDSRALLMLQVDPVYIAGQDSFLSEITEKCGWKNAFPGNGYPRVGREQLELMSMERIVYFSMLGQKKEEKAVQEFWAKSMKHRSVPLLIENNPHLAQLGVELPRLTQEFCERLGRK